MFGNCQRPVSSLGVTHNMQKFKSVKIWLNKLFKLQENNDGKNTLLHNFVCFQMPEKGFRPEVILLKNYVTSEWAISHNVVYYILSNHQTCPVPLISSPYRVCSISFPGSTPVCSSKWAPHMCSWESRRELLSFCALHVCQKLTSERS